MDLSRFWGICVVIFGGVNALLFAALTVRAKVPVATKILGYLIAAVCLYPTLLWGGQLFGAWSITPAFGRPALVLTLAALLWLGILSLGHRE